MREEKSLNRTERKGVETFSLNFCGACNLGLFTIFYSSQVQLKDVCYFAREGAFESNEELSRPTIYYDFFLGKTHPEALLNNGTKIESTSY
jgi:hypothetical protein